MEQLILISIVVLLMLIVYKFKDKIQLFFDKYTKTPRKQSTKESFRSINNDNISDISDISDSDLDKQVKHNLESDIDDDNIESNNDDDIDDDADILNE